jgi:hypothetical protein
MLNKAQRTGFHKIFSRARPGRWFAAATTILGVVGSSVAAFAAALALLPATLVLPAVGLGLIVAAAMLAVIAVASPAEVTGPRVFFWDIAGGLALIGLCATGLAESEPVLALLNQER